MVPAEAHRMDLLARDPVVLDCRIRSPLGGKAAYGRLRVGCRLAFDRGIALGLREACPVRISECKSLANGEILEGRDTKPRRYAVRSSDLNNRVQRKTTPHMFEKGARAQYRHPTAGVERSGAAHACPIEERGSAGPIEAREGEEVRCDTSEQTPRLGAQRFYGYSKLAKSVSEA